MAAIIQIKRSGESLQPSLLKVGELAYSYRDSSRKLFIGIGPADSNDDASDISIIGGEYYTDLLNVLTPGISEPNKFLLLGNLKDVDYLRIRDLYADDAEIERLTVGDVEVFLINADRINVSYLEVDSSDINLLRVLRSYTEEAYIDSANIEHAFIDSADITLARIDTAYIDSANIEHAFIDSADITLARIDTAYIDSANIEHAFIDSADITLSRTKTAYIDSANIEHAFIDSADIVLSRTKTAYIDSANIEHAFIDSADIVLSRTKTAYIDSANIEHAFIDSADIVLARIDTVYINTAYIDSANVEHAFIDSADIVLSRTKTAYIDSANVEHAFIDSADIVYADIDSADIDILRVLKADIDSSTLIYATIKETEIDLARIKNVYIDSADITNAHIINLKTDSLYSIDATIDSAYIRALSVNGLQAGEIFTGVIKGPEIIIIDPSQIGDNSGKLVVLGDLQVEGITTTINSTTVTINDKNIVLADSAEDATQADGAGITINGANASITYSFANDRFIINKDIEVPSLYASYSDIDSADITLSRTNTAYIDSANIEHAFVDSADIVLARVSTSYIDSANIKHAFIDSADITLSRTNTAYIDSANVKHAFIDSADIVLARVSTGYIDSANIKHAFIDSADITLSRTNTAYIDSANIEHAFIDSADITLSRTNTAYIDSANIEHAFIDSADITLSRIDTAYIDSANVKHAFIDSADIVLARVSTAYIDSADIEHAFIDSADIVLSRTNTAYIDSANVKHAFIDSADIVLARVSTAYIDSANIKHAFVDSADIALSRTNTAYIDSANIEHAFIDSADIVLARVSTAYIDSSNIKHAFVDSADIVLARVSTAYIDSANIKHTFIDSADIVKLRTIELTADSAYLKYAKIDSTDIEVLRTSQIYTSLITGPEQIVIDPLFGNDSGNVVIRGNLIVQGYTTTLNSTEVTINDKNLVLADSASDSNEAHGAGITINGANAKITYSATSDKFEFNKGINVPSLDVNYLTADSAYVRTISGDSAYLKGILVENIHVTGKLTGNIGFDGVIPNSIIIANDSGTLTSDSDILFNNNQFVLYVDKARIDNQGNMTIAGDLNVGGTVIGQQGIQIGGDLEANRIFLKDSSINPGFVFVSGQNDSITGSYDLMFGSYTSNEHGSFNGLNIGLERLYDSGYYRFSVNRNTGAVAAQSLKVGDYPNRPIGQYSQTYPFSGVLPFYGFEVDDKVITSTAQLNTFQTDISRNAALLLDSFSEAANIIQVKSLLDSTLFEVKKDGSINFFGSLLKDGIPYEAAGVFKKTTYEDVYYDAPIVALNPTDPQSILLRNSGRGGRVGINTKTPKHQLEIIDGELFISGPLNTGSTYPETINIGYTYPNNTSKFLFFPQKAATRAGHWNSDLFSSFNFGNYSTAFGRNVNAIGISTVAIGDSASAVTDYSIAIGKNINTGTNNDRTIVIGIDNNVVANSGNYIIVLGSGNTNAGDETHIIGRNNNATATADRAYVFGRENTISGLQSTIIGASNNISGSNSRVFGRDNVITSFAPGSTVIGNDNYTDATQTIIIGSNAKTFGQNAMALGPDIQVSGNFSVGLSLSGAAQKPVIDSDNVFGILGGGVIINPTLDSYQLGNNALVVVGDILYTGQIRQAVVGGGTVSGNIFVDDGTDVTYTEGKNLGIHVDSPYDRFQTAGSFSVRDETPSLPFIPADPDTPLILDFNADDQKQFLFHPRSGVLRAGQIQFLSNDSIGILSIGLGYRPVAADYATAIGYNAIAGGNYSVSIGKDITSFGPENVVIGQTNTEVNPGSSNYVIGKNNEFDGSNLYVYGKNNTVLGANNYVIGEYNNVISGTSYVLGFGNTINGDYSTAIGRNITLNTPRLIVLNPENASYIVDSVSDQVIIPGSNTKLAVAKTSAVYTLDVGGNVNLDGLLYINGELAGIFAYDSITGTYLVPEGISAKGDLLIDVNPFDGRLDLRVDSTGTTIYDSVGISGNTSIGGYASVKGNLDVGGSITIDSNANITVKEGTLYLHKGNVNIAEGNITLSKGDLTLNEGDIFVKGDLTVDSGSTYIEDLFIKGISFDSYLVAALTGNLDALLADRLREDSVQGSIDIITSTSPVTVTTTNPHGLGENWTIEFDSIQGMTFLNSGTYFVDVINTLSFELYDDSSGNLNRNPIDGRFQGTHVNGTGSFIGYPYTASTPIIPSPSASLFDGLLDLIDTDYVQARVTLDNFWSYNPSVGPALSFNFDPDPLNRVPVGIHTRTPGINYSLDVNGNVNVRGNLYVGGQEFTTWFADNGGDAITQIIDATYINQLVQVNESTIVNFIDSNYVTNIITDEYILARSRDSDFWQRSGNVLFFGTYPNVYNVSVGIGTDEPITKFQVAGKGTFDSGLDITGNLFVKEFMITTDSSYEYTFTENDLTIVRSKSFDSDDIETAYFTQILDSTNVSFLLNLEFSNPFTKYLDVYTIDRFGDSQDLQLAESEGALGISGDYLVTGPSNNFIRVSTSAVDSSNLWIYFIERRLPSDRLTLKDSDNNNYILDYNTNYVEVIISDALGQPKATLSSSDIIKVDNTTIIIKDSSYLELNDIITINDRSPKILSQSELWGQLDQYGNVIVHDGNVTLTNGNVTVTGKINVTDSAILSGGISTNEISVSNRLTNHGISYFNGDVYVDSSAVFYYGPSRIESDGEGNAIVYRLSFDSNVERIVDSNYISNRLQDIWKYNNDEFGNQQVYYDRGGAIIVGRPTDMLPGDSDTKFLNSRGNAIFKHDSIDTLNSITENVVPNFGEGARMMWIPQRGAFRAGYVENLGGITVWDDNKVGLHSVGIGHNTEAGHFSIALGYNVSAGTLSLAGGEISVGVGINVDNRGDNSIAIGKDLISNVAENAVSIGKNINNTSHNNLGVGDTITLSQNNAENVGIGKNITVTGSSNGVGIGRNITASRGAIAIGDTNSADLGGVSIGRDNSATYGVSVGIQVNTARSNSVGVGVLASSIGSASTAIGGNSQAYGSNSTAVGNNSQAYGNSGTSVGINSRANASSAVAVGSSNNASASSSVAVGVNNQGQGSSGVAIGLSNNASTGAIAIGTSNQATLSSIVVGRSNYGYQSIVFGSGNNVSSSSAIAIGYNNIGNNGVIMFGKNNSNNSNSSGLFGISNNSNDNAFAFGKNNNSNQRSSLFGDNNTGNNTSSYVYGAFNTSNSISLIYGRNNSSNTRSYVYGNYNSSGNKINVFGNYNTGSSSVSVSGDYGYIYGNSSVVTNYGFAYGSRNNITNGGYIFGSQSTITTGGYSFGEGNTISFGGFAFGEDNTINGTNGTPYAFGLNNTVSDNGIAFGKNNNISSNSIGLGNNVTASGLNSLSFGNNVSTSGNYSIAIGLSSVSGSDTVTRNNTLAILGGQVGVGVNDPDFLYQMEIGGSVNVRSGDIYRQGKRLYNYILEDVANRNWIRTNADSNYIYSAVDFDYLRTTLIPQYFFYNDYGTPVSNLYYTGGGNVGIKTSTPQYDLHVNGDINFDGKLYVGGVEIVPSKDSLNDVAIDVNYYQSFYYIDSATTVESFIDSAYVQQRQSYFDYLNIIDANYINTRVDFSFLPDSFYIEDQINIFSGDVIFKKDALGFAKYKNTEPAAAFLGTRIGIGYDSTDFLAKGAGLDIMNGGVFIENGNLEITNGNIYIDGELFAPNSPFIDDGTFVSYNPINGPLLNVGIGKFTPRYTLDVAGDINIDLGYNFKINDQNLLHEILDSAYINSKLDRSLFLDSAEALGLIDVDYIRGIADSNYIRTAADSAWIQSIIDSSYLFDIVDSAYIRSVADSAYILDIADSSWIKSVADSSYILDIADSSWIKSVADSAYILDIADSSWIKSVADSAYILDIADSSWIKSVADEIYVKTIANIPYIRDAVDINYVRGLVDSGYIIGATGIGTKDIDFGVHKILYSNKFTNIASMPSAGVYGGMFAYDNTNKKPVVSDNGVWTVLARENKDVIFNKVTTTDDLIIGGNLQVNGTTSTVNSVTLEVTDNMIYMNAAESSGSPTQYVDIGFAGNYNDIGSYAHAGFFRDATDGIWKIFEGYTPEPDAASQINIDHPSFSLAKLQVSEIIADQISRISNVAIGVYGSASLIPVIKLDSNGFIDSIGEVSVAGVDSVSYNTTNGQFTIFTADGNSFSDSITLEPFTTDNLLEGINLYFTTARADSAFDVRLSTKTTDDLVEGINLYFTTARADSAFDVRLSTKTTDDLVEGINLYYTDSRVSTLVDSAYVMARVEPRGVDSAAVTALIDSAYVNARVSTIDSAQVLAIVDSNYIRSIALDSSAVTSLIDSAYINERIGIIAEVSLLANQLRYQTYYFAATPGQTVVSGVDQNGNTLEYSIGTVQVFLNGINLLNGVDYTATNGSSITLTNPTNGNEDIFISTLKITGEVGFGFREYIFTADSGQSEFFGADDNGLQLQYTVGNLIAHLNGIKLLPGIDYTATDGNKITLIEPLLLEDELTITTAYVQNSQLDSDLNVYGDITVSGLTNTSGRYTNLVNGIEADSSGVVIIDTVEHQSRFTSIEYLVHMEDSSNGHSQISKMLVTYNKTNVFSTEYGIINSYQNDSDMGILSVDVSGNVIRLRFEKATGTGNVTVKPVKTIIQ